MVGSIRRHLAGASTPSSSTSTTRRDTSCTRAHAAFYTPAGLGKLVGHLHPGGVFALWSDDPPDPAFEALLAEVFDRSQASIVRFPNPLTGGYSTNTVYVAR